MQQPRKDTVIKIRVDPTQKADFDWAARRLGVQLSTWLRQLALGEVRRVKERIKAQPRSVPRAQPRAVAPVKR